MSRHPAPARRSTLTVLAALSAVSLMVLAGPARADGPSPIAPISPVAPIPGASIQPVAPSAPASPAGAATAPTRPNAPTSPRTPSVSGNAPDAGSEQAGAAGAASQIAGQVSAVTTQIGTLSNLTGSTTDGYPAAGTRQDLVAALAKGRDLLSTLSVAPQNAVDADGCPTSAPAGTLRSDATAMGVSRICSDSVAQAPTPEAAKALKWVLAQLGAPYACGGVGRDDTYRFDCSSLVSRAYSQGAGLKVAKPLTWTPSTRDMIPNDGHTLASWVKVISNDQVRPGDIALYSTGNGNFHVVMLLADGLMIHTNRCGDVAHITKFWGYSPTFAKFLGVRRIDPAGA